jgi:glycosyltransferase involved in cell wall biosynthesis
VVRVRSHRRSPQPIKPDPDSTNTSEESVNREPAVLIIVQNLPVPFDRRVWLECQALTQAGYSVSVICPKGPGDPSDAVIDGVTLYKYRAPVGGTSKVGFLREYLYSFCATAWLTSKAWRRGRFDVLQACNPPDIFWPIALVLRPFGVRFVFDHHDLCPELYVSRFETGSKLVHRSLLALERWTHQAAHHVTVTNDSYWQIATTRGGKREDDVTVVRTGPDVRELLSVPEEAALRRGRPHLVVYLGVMGPQDGVALAVRAADYVVHELRRDDISFTFIGSGDSLASLIALRDELGLEDYVEFAGRVPDQVVARILSTADVGLCPDPKNPLNDVSTMNKTMEYMAFALPVVAFDLRETRVSAAEAAVYARPNEVADLARLLIELIDDEPRRESMGKLGRARVVDTLAWEHQRAAYVGVFDALVGRTETGLEGSETGGSPLPSRQPTGASPVT